MVSSMCKGFFLLFVFILPDVILCYGTEKPNFLVDREGNRRYLGLLPGGKRLPEKEYGEGSNDPLPESFDVREKWPQCKHITDKIRDQKNCKSCWAFSVAEVISDRICIKSNGTTQVLISPEDLMTCCDDKNGCIGCQGGVIAVAYEYWVKQGIVTGGDFESDEGCRPYTILDGWNDRITPPCNKTCREGYSPDYNADRHYGLNGYSISEDEKKIQQEIYENGPVSSGIYTEQEFSDYTKGVMRIHTTTDFVDHAIKILGWGVEDGTPYWLCANSWGAGWGEKGYFKVLRGDPNNSGNIEKYVQTGIPKL